jgi:hypothetical protein
MEKEATDEIKIEISFLKKDEIVSLHVSVWIINLGRMYSLVAEIIQWQLKLLTANDPQGFLKTFDTNLF